MPALAIAAATGGINLSTPSQAAVADIPPDDLMLYQEAGLAFDVPWEVIAGIGKVECDHGRNPDPACWQEGKTNAAGAGGPMQFLPSTWQTYGIAANGSGTPDRWNAADAILSAANYLKANGAPENIEAAVFAYNHSDAYVQQVLAWAGLYASEYGPNTTAPTQVTGDAQAPTSAAQAASPTRSTTLVPRISGAAKALAASTVRVSCKPPMRPPVSGCRASRRPSTTPARPSLPVSRSNPATLSSSALTRPM